MVKRISTLVLLGALAVSVSGCDKCGDWLKPKGPFSQAACKADEAR
ncbi:MAG: hypothetical protein IPK23_12505 [Rhizobiales bacterium]|jgi:hypothetical protein|nr:hypothetical protein [Hyphomicrobiales bacterium]